MATAAGVFDQVVVDSPESVFGPGTCKALPSPRASPCTAASAQTLPYDDLRTLQAAGSPPPPGTLTIDGAAGLLCWATLRGRWGRSYSPCGKCGLPSNVRWP